MRNITLTKSINSGSITRHFLATVQKYRSLMFGFRVAHNTIPVIVRQTCEAILAEYGDKVLQCPHTSNAWKPVAAKVSSRWNFHHTLDAIDGKHVAIRCPKNDCSFYSNYKGLYSIILLAPVDVKYKFLWVDVGISGSSSDAQIFNECYMYLRLGIVDGTLDIPDAEILPGDKRDMLYFLNGDDAFSLRTWLMKPFSARGLPDAERIFNYRLSCAEKVVENAFVIMANRFGCLLTTMCQNPESSILLAYCTLQDIMKVRYPQIHQGIADEEDDNHRVIPRQCRQGAFLQDIEDVVGGKRDTQVVKRQRLYLKYYYNGPVGATAGQRDMNLRLSHWPRTFFTLTYDNNFIIFSNFLLHCYIIICVALSIGHYILVEIKSYNKVMILHFICGVFYYQSQRGPVENKIKPATLNRSHKIFN